jgi:farnesyl diphosphate synthase
VTLLGVQAAKKMAADLHAEALQTLEEFGERAQRLRELATFIVMRKY